MVVLRLLSVSLFIFALCACSSFPVDQDYNDAFNFSSLKTFAWAPNSHAKNQNAAHDSSLVQSRIFKAVNLSLSQKGFKKVSSAHADFLIQYHFHIVQAEQKGGVRTGVGVGSSNRGNYGGVSFSFGKSKGERSRLIIDILNPSDKKLLWRGSTTGEFSGNDTPDKNIENINNGIAAIIKRFPPQ